jgi:hypothetical protein
MQYGIMSFDNPESPDRPEYPIKAKTDKGARVAAKKEANRLGIKNYQIIFYRSSDGCRGSIDK